MKHQITLSAFFVLALTAALSITDGRSAPAPPWVAPASASSQRNPFAGDAAAIARGKQLYQSVCIACHGSSGAGDGPAGLALPVPPGNLTSSEASAQSDGAFHWKIVNGRAPMPGFAGAYGKDDLWKLVSYIRTLSPGDGPSTPAGATPSGTGAAAGTVSRGEYNRLQNELTLLKAQMLALLEKQGITPEEVTPENLPPLLPETDENMLGGIADGTDLFPSGDMGLVGDPALSGGFENAAQLPAGRTNFLLTGFAFAGFDNLRGEDSSFNAGFSPVFLWKQGENLMFEAELEVELEDHGTVVGLEYAQMIWAANDYMTIGVGKFLNPASYFSERIHPAWINKLPNAPLPFSHGTGLMAGSQTGVQVRGAVPIPLGKGKSRLNYAFYASNGPALTVEEEEEEEGHGEPVGSLEFDNNEDQNNNKAVGGRVGFQPFAGFEVGYGFEMARVDPSGLAPEISGIDAVTHVVDASYVLTCDRLKGTIDMRSQFVWLDIDNPGVDPLDFTNHSEGGYAQLAYRPLKLDNEFIKNLEIVSRYDWISLPTGRSDITRWTWGLNYWLNPSTVLKAAYESGTEEGEGDFSGIRVQAAVGF